MTGTHLGVAVAGAAVFGLVIGSFLNVVIYRVPRRLSISRPPSHCPVCSTPLGPIDNVPLLSWLMLRGRCRHCRASIPLRYPLVEGITAVAFALLALATRAGAPLIPLLLLAAGVVVVVAIDLDGFAVPPALVGVVVLAAGGLTAVSLADGSVGRLGWAAAGATGSALAWWPLSTSSAEGRPLRPSVVLAGVGWCAGWLWPPAALIVAGTLLGMALVGRRSPSRSTLWLPAATGLVIVVVAAGLGLP